MKKKIIKILAEKGEIYFTELKMLIPEIKGKFAIYMPVKDNINPNILLLDGVSSDFIKIFNELFIEKKIYWNAVRIVDILTSGAPMYSGIPIATMKRAKTKEHCWLPIKIKLKERRYENEMQ